jgi:hypothetical protein
MNTNFQQKQREEQTSTSTSESKSEVEFATAEEALRFDAEQNPPPPEIAERLNKSLADEPKHETSFWTKLGFRK